MNQPSPVGGKRTPHITHNLTSKGKRFFAVPEVAGRTITAGFSFIQRITKSANIDVWFPEALREKLYAKMLSGEQLTGRDFPAEWAAVRQFELLQEAGNYKIYDLQSDHLTRTMVDLAQNMRAGGYRVTVATIGGYDKDAQQDDLTILDERLQERISALTHMLYLDEESRRSSDDQAAKLKQGAWNYQTDLPHVAVTLGARNLFRPIKDPANPTAAERRHKLAQGFFDILGQLPQCNIVHETAIGLQLPDLSGEHQWIYLADAENTLRSFNTLMTDLFSPFDRISLGRLQGYEGADYGVKATVQHMRSYGDRLNAANDGFYRGVAGVAFG